MRIVGGRHRGRPLTAPPGRLARPTADRARESVFNILLHGLGLDLEGAVVVDAFAGSGALGLEALSRGAGRAYFIDDHRAAAEAIRANLEALGETGRGTVIRVDATRPPPAREACGLAFLDPPYGSGLAAPALAALAARGWLTAEAVCAVEIAAREAFDPPPGFEVADRRRYGAGQVIFLRRVAAAPFPSADAAPK